jgi:hypothetical protein
MKDNEDVTDEARRVAIRFLQAMVEAAGGRARETVHPNEAARQIGLDPEEPLCTTVAALLQTEDAIEEHELGAVSVGDTHGFYRLTPRGVDIAKRGSFR